MKAFGIILIIAAVVCGIVAYTQTQETELERLNQNVISSSEKSLSMSKGFGEFLDASAQLQGQRPPPRDIRVLRDEENSRNSLSRASADADRYKSERNQKMMLWLGGAAVSFLAGIICIATAKSPTTNSATTT